MTSTHLIGWGVHTRLGRGLQAHARELLSASSRPVDMPASVTIALADEEVSAPYHLAAGEPLGDDPERNFRILGGVVADAVESSGLDPAQLRRTGLFVGSSSSDIAMIEQAFQRDIATDPQAAPLNLRSSMANLEWWIRSQFCLGPVGFSVNTACTASSNALLYADAAIRSGQIEHALVVGAEVFNATTALGFHSLDLLTRTGMRPFDDRRNGLVLGEGCAAVILSRTSVRVGDMRLLGGAAVSDAHSISAPNPDGVTVADTLRRALASAGVGVCDIQAIKAHATASLLNDEAEAAGIRAIFDPVPLLCALKPFIGHTFGASGLVELALLVACLNAGFWPASPGIASDDAALVRLPQAATPLSTGRFALNTFGFGGNNNCLIVAND